MAIVKVQSVAANTATIVLNGVVVHNSLICEDGYLRGTSTGLAEAVPTDSNGTFLTAAAPIPVNSTSQDTGNGIFYEQDAAAGTHTVTPEANTGHWATLTEYSGLANSGMLDQVSSGNTLAGAGTSLTTGNTPATTQASELLVAAFCGSSLGGFANIGLTDPITGYTTLKLSNNTSSDLAIQQAEQIISSTGVQSATINWTQSDSSAEYAAVIATFKGAASNALGANFGNRPHPGASPGLGGIQSARFNPSNWWPYGVANVTVISEIIGAWTWAGLSSKPVRIFGATPGAYTWKGNNSPLSVEILAKVGAWTWAGTGNKIAASIAARPGAYTWAGTGNNIAKSIASTVGAYTWAGTHAAVFGNILAQHTGTYTWAGRPSPLSASIASRVGAWSWAGTHSAVTVPGATATTNLYPRSRRLGRR